MSSSTLAAAERDGTALPTGEAPVAVATRNVAQALYGAGVAWRQLLGVFFSQEERNLLVEAFRQGFSGEEYEGVIVGGERYRWQARA